MLLTRVYLSWGQGEYPGVPISNLFLFSAVEGNLVRSSTCHRHAKWCFNLPSAGENSIPGNQPTNLASFISPVYDGEFILMEPIITFMKQEG